MGEIITFYSYKGGTGRSMALANVGWILAAAGKRVLLVDWDLEAPGLHRYLHPFLLDKELSASRGLIDIVMDFAVQAMTPGEGGDWYLKYADVLRYALSLDWPGFGNGRLDLLPAGQQNASYATRVNSFNWDNFYERLGGGTFLEAVKESMKHEYDYVLVDSRTGVSDTSGICTVQMPDKVVVCFTLNRQSIQGAAAVAESIVAARRKQPQLSSLRVFPVPTRVERTEHVRLEASRKAAQDLFASYLEHWDETTRRQYWSEIEVYYQAYYALEEVLAPFGDERSEAGSLLYSMEKLAWYLTAVEGWTSPTAEQKTEVLKQFLRVVPVSSFPATVPPAVDLSAPAVVSDRLVSPGKPVDSGFDPPATSAPVPARAEGARRYWFVLSCADSDDGGLVQRLAHDISVQIRFRQGLRDDERPAFLDLQTIKTGAEWSFALLNALRKGRSALCLISPRYVSSYYCGQEFTVLQAAMPILPVMWDQTEPLPEILKTLEFFGQAELEKRGLRNLMRFARFRESYNHLVRRLTDRVVELAESPRPPVSVPQNLEAVPNAFGSDRLPGFEVLFVYAVPTLQDVVGLKVDASLYGETPETWRPFGSHRLREMVGRIAIEMGLRYRGAAISESAATEVKQWTESGQLCLVLLDPVGVGVHWMAELLSRHYLSVPAVALGRSEMPVELPSLREYVVKAPEADSEEQLSGILKGELTKLRALAITRAADRLPVSGPKLPRLL